jgi:hypothetical protein
MRSNKRHLMPTATRHLTRGHHVCTTGRALAGVLRRDLGEGRFRTVHASRTGDATCFLAHATYGTCICGRLKRRWHVIVGRDEQASWFGIPFFPRSETAYAVGLLRHLSSPPPTGGGISNGSNGSDRVPVTYVEPLPAHLKISPDFIAYASQEAAPAVGGSAALRLKVARLREQEQGRSSSSSLEVGFHWGFIGLQYLEASFE